MRTQDCKSIISLLEESEPIILVKNEILRKNQIKLYELKKEKSIAVLNFEIMRNKNNQRQAVLKRSNDLWILQ